MKTALTFVTLLATAGSARATGDGITLVGSETEATVTLHGIHAISPAVRTVGDRLEIDVADESPAQATLFNDATVRKVEVIGGAHAHVSLLIKHSTKTTEVLGRAARVEDTDDELTIRIPRDAKAAAAMTQEPIPAPSPTPIPAPAPSPKTAAVLVPVPMPAPPPAPAPTTPALALADSPKLPTGTLLALGGIAGAVLLIQIARKRRAKPAEPKRAIDVLASRALGGKTRLVLISVEDNELLLSVTDQGAHLLLSWPSAEDKDDWRAATATPAPRETGGPAGLRTAGGAAERSPLDDDWRAQTATPQAVGIAPPRLVPAAPAAPTARGTVDFGRAPSPAVSGLLKLKLGNGSAPHPSTDDDDDGDVNRDAAWVKELVKAARRGGQAS